MHFFLVVAAGLAVLLSWDASIVARRLRGLEVLLHNILRDPGRSVHYFSDFATAFDYLEPDWGAGVDLAFRGVRLVHSEASEFQKIQVLRHPYFGKILTIDDDLMLTERDHHVYHEMITHVPLSACGRGERPRVLVVGGGDGGVACQLQHYDADVVLVDIDARVSAVARDHFPEIGQCLDAPRVTLVHTDAAAWAERAAASGRQFDAVIVDSTEFGAAESLLRPSFLRALAALLRPGGAGAINLTGGSWNEEGVRAAVARIGAAFQHTAPFHAFIPTYVSGHYVFALFAHTRAVLDRARHPSPAAPARRATRYHSDAVQRAAFALPRSLADALEADAAATAAARPKGPPSEGGPRATTSRPIAGRRITLTERAAPAPPLLERLGTHVLAEAVGPVDHPALNDAALIRGVCERAAGAAGLTVVDSTFHAFHPHGVTGLVLLSESHISIHTWPEHGYAAIDVYACNQTGSLVPHAASVAHRPAVTESAGGDPWLAARLVAEGIGAEFVATTWTDRGLPAR